MKKEKITDKKLKDFEKRVLFGELMLRAKQLEEVSLSVAQKQQNGKRIVGYIC
jgi:hypothetical protein